MSSYPLFFLPNPQTPESPFFLFLVWPWLPQVIWEESTLLPVFFLSLLAPYFPPRPKGAPPIVCSIQTLHGMFLSREFPISIRTCLLIFLLATNNLPVIKPTPLSFLSLSFFFLSPPLLCSPLILHIFWGWVWTFSFFFFVSKGGGGARER